MLLGILKRLAASSHGRKGQVNFAKQFDRPVFEAKAPIVNFLNTFRRLSEVHEFKVRHEVAFYHELSGAHGTHIAVDCRVHMHANLPVT
jgi:hypothetical protein